MACMNALFALDPQSWADLRRLLGVALELPAARRDDWLRDLPPEDACHVPRLRALLGHAAGDDLDGAAADGSVSPAVARLLLTIPKVETDHFAPATPPSDAPPPFAGPYRLLGELGHGGMASVWLAERTDMLHSRQVALKLPHGAWHRAGLAERLAREREILATLNHPNIATLFDAGVDAEGRPWLALEFVQGERIDAYCAQRDLGVPERLRLFLQVALAVAHAHANLVVHRDLKPSNILVTPQGRVKLLDFGIAKLLAQDLAAETELTHRIGRALTPDYAAPEQLLGQPIGTSADVYALGVVLFELLAGERPYTVARGPQGELQARLAQQRPPRPSDAAVALGSARQRALRGDLDTIVLKALKFEPAERYATVAALADDIERHLDGRPVLAQPDRVAYRVRKFVLRHRWSVAAAGVLMLSIVIGAAAALWQAHRADLQRDVALLEQQRAAAYAEFMTVLLQDAGRPDQPLTPTQMLERGVAMLDRSVDTDEAVAAPMWYELSRIHLMFMQTDREVALLERSAALAQRLHDNNLLAAAECSLAWSLVQRDLPAAERHLAAGLAALDAASPAAEYARRDCLRGQGRVMQQRGDLAGAIAVVERGMRQLHRSGPALGLGHDFLWTQLTDQYRAADRFKDALVLAQARLDEIRAAGRAGSMAELVGMNNVAGNLARIGEFQAAWDIQRQALAWVERPDMAGLKSISLRSNLAATLVRLDAPERALALARADLALAAQAGNGFTQAISRRWAARALLSMGRTTEALADLDAAETFFATNARGNERFLRDLALVRALVMQAEGRSSDALRALQSVLDAARYPADLKAPGIDSVLREGAAIALAAGDAALAEKMAADGLKIAVSLARDADHSADVGESALRRAQALERMGRVAEALADARRAARALGHGVGAEHPLTGEAQGLVTRLSVAH
jgi:eukaryotic-like serine/threonine-protein kinase